MSARKAERPPVGLQRGLGIDAQDGWREARRAFDTTQYASTGPRHRCRGWQGGGSGNGGTLTLLQRGLGIDAEDGRRTLLECSQFCGLLQRGLGIDAEDGTSGGIVMNMAFPCFNGGLGIDAEDGRRRERSPGG